jgi:hypothetical protein
MCQALKLYCKICKELYHQQDCWEYNHCQKPNCLEINYTDCILGFCEPCYYVDLGKRLEEKENF